MMMNKRRTESLIGVLAFLGVRGVFGLSDAEHAGLEELLKKAAAYSARLESAALDFTCTEEITETQTFIRRPPNVKVPPNTTSHELESFSRAETAQEAQSDYLRRGSSFVIRKNSWVYDYQLVRRQRVIDERRTLLRLNGQDRREANASLNTFRIWFKDVIMCPAGLFGDAARETHDYRLLGRDKVFKVPAAIIEVKLKPGAGPGLSGKAWVGTADGSVLKVEWTADALVDSPLVAKQALDLNASPRISLHSEFGIEKNGLRFLSGHRVTEAYYVREARKIFSRSKLEVSYRDYRNFTVETNVDF